MVVDEEDERGTRLSNACRSVFMFLIGCIVLAAYETFQISARRRYVWDAMERPSPLTVTSCSVATFSFEPIWTCSVKMKANSETSNTVGRCEGRFSQDCGEKACLHTRFLEDSLHVAPTQLTPHAVAHRPHPFP